VKPVSKPRLLLFAFGDFAFNLYWQSIMLFLLFYYTDALGLPIGIAATTYMVASVWDGIANFTAGVLVDRGHDRLRYGPLIVAGAVPLGLTFVLTYMPPLASGIWAIASILVAHLLFRTAYAGVNVPYLAMSARMSPDSGDRAFVAGTRMLFGTAAAVTVALSTVPLGRKLTGSSAAQAYFGAAIVFALVGAAILVIVGLNYREATRPERPLPGSLKAALVSLARNRAFVTLNAAMMAMIVAITVLNKSVLYYFKYLLNDPEDGTGQRHRDPRLDAARPLCRPEGAVADCRFGRHGRAGRLRRDAVRRRGRNAALPGWHAGDDRRTQFRVLGDDPQHYRIWRTDDRAARRGHGVRRRGIAAADRDRNCYRDPRLELRLGRLRRQRPAERRDPGGDANDGRPGPARFPGAVVRSDAAQSARARTAAARR
jgi:hypothetical protein